MASSQVYGGSRTDMSTKSGSRADMRSASRMDTSMASGKGFGSRIDVVGESSLPASYKSHWTYQPGKRITFRAGFTCQVFSLITLMIGYVTSYWIQSWARVHSGFKHIGLWEACFSGLVLQYDPSLKSYHGCWWMLSTEFNDVKAWIMPWWFLMTQILLTLCIVAEIINVILLGILWLTLKDSKTNQGSDVSFVVKHVVAGIAVVTAIVESCVMLLFGLGFYLDRGWLPMYYLNFLSWSYGLAIVSSFLSIFAAIAQVMYALVERQEKLHPPVNYSLPSTADTSLYGK